MSPTIKTSLLALASTFLAVGCAANGSGHAGESSADVVGAKSLEQQGAWTNASMPDGTSVEDYAVGRQIPDLYSASIYVVSRPVDLDRETFRSDLTISVSNDFGKSFTNVGAIAGAPINAHVFVAPSDDRIVFVTAGGLSTGMGPADAEGVLWKSVDGGHTFTKSAAADAPTVLDIDPADANHIVGATCHGLFRSVDGGVTFARVPGSPDVGGMCNSAELHRSAKDRNVMYVLYSVGEGGGSEIRRTTDGAGTWETVASGEAMKDFAIHPNDPNHVYVFDSMQGWLSSADGGKTMHAHNSSLKLGDDGAFYSAPISNVAFETWTGGEPSLFLVNDSTLKVWKPGSGPEGGAFANAFSNPPAQLASLRFETLYESLKDGSPTPALIDIAGPRNAPRTLAVATFSVAQ